MLSEQNQRSRGVRDGETVENTRNRAQFGFCFPRPRSGCRHWRGLPPRHAGPPRSPPPSACRPQRTWSRLFLDGVHIDKGPSGELPCGSWIMAVANAGHPVRSRASPPLADPMCRRHSSGTAGGGCDAQPASMRSTSAQARSTSSSRAKRVASAQQAIEHQPFVGVGRLHHERRTVEEVHVDGAQPHHRAWNLGRDLQRGPLDARLDAHHQPVGRQEAFLHGRLRERQVRGILFELDRNLRCAAGATACPSASKTAYRPSASCRSSGGRRRRSRCSTSARH